MARNKFAQPAAHDVAATVVLEQSQGVIDWAGGAGGSGDWDTPANWTGDAVPAADDIANFALGGEAYTVAGGNDTIGAIQIAADTVTFDNAVTQDAGLTGTFLTATGNADVILGNPALFVGMGGLSFGAGTVLDVQGTLISGGGTADSVTAEHFGATTLTSATTLSSLSVLTGATFVGDVVLRDGGSLTVDSSAFFFGNSSTGNNSITLLGSGTIDATLVSGGAAAMVTIGAALNLGASSTVTLVSDPAVTLMMNGAISGDGGVLVDGGSVALAAVDSYTGATAVTDGATLTVLGQGAVPGGTITLTNATLVTQPDSTGAVAFGDTVFGTGTSDTVAAMAGNLLVFAGATDSFSFIGGAGTDTIVGGDNALSVTSGTAGDLVFGGAGTLDFTGGSQATGTMGISTIVGASGAMTVTGGSESEIVFGGAGGLSFTGGLAPSTLVGGAGIVNATAGGDGGLMYGGTSGQDTLNTGLGAGPTTVVGGNGAQLFASGFSNDVLVDGSTSTGATLNAAASSGNDTLFGGVTGTSDTIITGSATDLVVLLGGATDLTNNGTAQVFAGSGVLTLEFTASDMLGSMTDVVGFNVNQDQIALNGYGAGEAAQILAGETVSGGNTILEIPNGNEVVLFGTTGLTAANFR